MKKIARLMIRARIKLAAHDATAHLQEAVALMDAVDSHIHKCRESQARVKNLRAKLASIDNGRTR